MVDKRLIKGEPATILWFSSQQSVLYGIHSEEEVRTPTKVVNLTPANKGIVNSFFLFYLPLRLNVGRWACCQAV